MLRELVVIIGCLMAGATLGVLVMAILVAGTRADDRMAEARAHEDKGQAEHIRRFSSWYNTEKANAPATRSGSSRDASVAARKPAGEESITLTGVSRNA